MWRRRDRDRALVGFQGLVWRNGEIYYHKKQQRCGCRGGDQAEKRKSQEIREDEENERTREGAISLWQKSGSFVCAVCLLGGE